MRGESRLVVVREGYVVRNLDDRAERDGQMNAVVLPLCRATVGGGTYAEAFVRHVRDASRGDPWRLQSWMRQKRIDETMIYCT
jgi:hypothetical protein